MRQERSFLYELAAPCTFFWQWDLWFSCSFVFTWVICMVFDNEKLCSAKGHRNVILEHYFDIQILTLFTTPALMTKPSFFLWWHDRSSLNWTYLIFWFRCNYTSSEARVTPLDFIFEDKGMKSFGFFTISMFFFSQPAWLKPGLGVCGPLTTMQRIGWWRA